MKKNRPVDKLYKTIANAQKKLEAIKKNCKHKKTRVGLYSWRIGDVNNAELCNNCDAVISNSSTFVISQGPSFAKTTFQGNLGYNSSTITGDSK